ncbi:hypothetical protein PMAYCL1PPCAC_04822 [Pristionchus mayeri]|uniref:Uncharacterized protein n=1 Tax=Pristionchus mayeri TaxID=1317129 RepID=A0AAN4Z513_9BILA|nr:hypothetical protein PMAYCL1PPCAC_04822 [Pristionchus mayeri]
MMVAQFDPNDPRYFHTLCLRAHDTKAARFMAITLLVWAIVRTGISAASANVIALFAGRLIWCALVFLLSRHSRTGDGLSFHLSYIK